MHDYWNGNIDAIVYPSVPERLLSSNIVIKPDILDNHFDLIEVEESVVTSTPNPKNSGYILFGTNYSKTFDFPADKILWDR